MEFKGSCHCGNITFALQWPDDARPIPARTCGCSFCVKHGGVWTSHPRARLVVRMADPGRVARYRFGTETADFHVCGSCGVTPLVTSRIDGRTYAVINVNTFDAVDRSCIQAAPASFDGEETQSRLDRRQRNWIGDVQITEGA
jgi:hypothetical protein